MSQESTEPGFGNSRRWILTGATLALLALLASGCGEDEAAGDIARSPTAAVEGSANPESDTARASEPMSMSANSPMMMETVASETWDGMRIEVATMAPTSFTLFQGVETVAVEPATDDSFHLMAVLADDASGERIPYADVWVTLSDPSGAIVFDERLWPMLSQAMGTHYGINVPLPGPGTYTVELQVGAPQGARHPEYADRWLAATTVRTTVEWAE